MNYDWTLLWHLDSRSGCSLAVCVRSAACIFHLQLNIICSFIILWICDRQCMLTCKAPFLEQCSSIIQMLFSVSPTAHCRSWLKSNSGSPDRSLLRCLHQSVTAAGGSGSCCCKLSHKFCDDYDQHSKQWVYHLVSKAYADRQYSLMELFPWQVQDVVDPLETNPPLDKSRNL